MAEALSNLQRLALALMCSHKLGVVRTAKGWRWLADVRESEQAARDVLQTLVPEK